MNEAVAQTHAIARAVVITTDRETSHQRMIYGFLIVAAVAGACLIAVHADREAVDVDRGSHHSVITIATGAPQMAVRPVE